MSKKRNKRAKTIRKEFYEQFQEEQEDVQKEGFGALLGVESAIQNFKKKMSEEQLAYSKDLGSKWVVMSDSSAGTGKTSVAVMRGLEMLVEGKVSKLMYVRFPDDRSIRLGYLPGDLDEKTKKLMKPLVHSLKVFGLTDEKISELINHEIIEMKTDLEARGDTFGDYFTIIDETQNGTIEDIRLILTRTTDGSYNAVIGHSGQVDSKLQRFGSNKLIPFQVFQRHMLKQSFTSLHHLTYDYRGEVSRWADKVQDTINELEEEQILPMTKKARRIR